MLNKFQKKQHRVIILATLLISTLLIMSSLQFKGDDKLYETIRLREPKQNPLKLAYDQSNGSGGAHKADGSSVLPPAPPSHVPAKHPSFLLGQSLSKDDAYSPFSIKTSSDPFDVVKDRQRTKSFFTEQNICPNIHHEGSVFVSQQQMLDVSMEAIEAALKDYPELEHMISKAYTRFRSRVPKHVQWLRFGGSSVWLSDLEAHFMVSRVYYSPSGIPNKGYVSFLYIQLFDKDWKEKPPQTVSVPYQQETVKKVVRGNGLVEDEVVEKELSHRDIKFPSFLPIPFDRELQSAEDWYYGPEDPRIVLRRNPLGFDEPLIVFNMKSLQILERVMHLYLPFSSHFTRLQKRNEPYTQVEKNWTPFIPAHNADEQNPHGDGDTEVHFIYSLDPLEIMKCSIRDGICDYVQRPRTRKGVGALRGGTQLMEFPNLLQSKLPANRRVFVGMARAHLNGCGCGESMYRPNLMLLVDDYNPKTDKHYYKVSHVSEYMDLNAKVKKWHIPTFAPDGKMNPPDETICQGRSVLIPNSIAYWSVKSIEKNGVTYSHEEVSSNMSILQEEGDVKYDDYMGVTLSSADSDVSIVHVRGLANYLTTLPTLWSDSTVVNSDDKFELNGYDFNIKCAIRGSDNYCKQYGDKQKAEQEGKKAGE